MFERLRKSFADIIQPDKNKLLKAIYEFTTHSGVANVMEDNPTSYLQNGYSGNDDVFSIINRIISMSQQATLRLYETKDKKWSEVTNHELCKFTRNVNPTQTLEQFKEGHLIYKLAIGNSYWYKPSITAGLNKGKTKELYLMPSNNVEVLGGQSWMNPVGGYILNGNMQVKFTQEEVYHSKFFNPLYGMYGDLYGQSPLKAAAAIVSKQNESTLTELKQFQNQAPPYMIYRDTTDTLTGWTPQQREQLEDVIKKHSKGDKRGGILAIPEKVGLLQFGASLVDLNILNSSTEGRRKLCNIYGFPAQLMNDTAGTTFNNVGEARLSAWTDCIMPNLNGLARDLTAFLIDPVSEYAGLFFAFDYSEVKELQKDLVKTVQWMIQAKCTPNEIREAVGYNAIPNPLMDEPFFTMADIPLSQLGVDISAPVLKSYGDYDKK